MSDDSEGKGVGPGATDAPSDPGVSPAPAPAQAERQRPPARRATPKPTRPTTPAGDDEAARKAESDRLEALTDRQFERDYPNKVRVFNVDTGLVDLVDKPDPAATGQARGLHYQPRYGETFDHLYQAAPAAASVEIRVFAKGDYPLRTREHVEVLREVNRAANVPPPAADDPQRPRSGSMAYGLSQAKVTRSTKGVEIREPAGFINYDSAKTEPRGYILQGRSASGTPSGTWSRAAAPPPAESQPAGRVPQSPEDVADADDEATLERKVATRPEQLRGLTDEELGLDGVELRAQGAQTGTSAAPDSREAGPYPLVNWLLVHNPPVSPTDGADEIELELEGGLWDRLKRNFTAFINRIARPSPPFLYGKDDKILAKPEPAPASTALAPAATPAATAVGPPSTAGTGATEIEAPDADDITPEDQFYDDLEQAFLILLSDEVNGSSYKRLEKLQDEVTRNGALSLVKKIEFSIALRHVYDAAINHLEEIDRGDLKDLVLALKELRKANAEFIKEFSEKSGVTIQNLPQIKSELQDQTAFAAFEKLEALKALMLSDPKVSELTSLRDAYIEIFGSEEIQSALHAANPEQYGKIVLQLQESRFDLDREISALPSEPSPVDARFDAPPLSAAALALSPNASRAFLPDDLPGGIIDPVRAQRLLEEKLAAQINKLAEGLTYCISTLRGLSSNTERQQKALELVIKDTRADYGKLIPQIIALCHQNGGENRVEFHVALTAYDATMQAAQSEQARLREINDPHHWVTVAPA